MLAVAEAGMMLELCVRKLARAWWAATEALDAWLPGFLEESAVICEEKDAEGFVADFARGLNDAEGDDSGGDAEGDDSGG